MLHWVTRIDDFKMLLEDLTEQERTVHLAQSEEAAHTFMRWYAQPNDPPEIVAARDIVSDYCCKLFLGQLNMVPLDIALRQAHLSEELYGMMQLCFLFAMIYFMALLSVYVYIS